MNRSVKWVLIGLGILIVILVGVKFWIGSKDDVVQVTVDEVSKRTIIETVNASGKIYPEVEVKISPDISGEIIELTVQEGDSVKKGQMLARIYADIYASQRDEASARVSQSQANVNNSTASIEALKAQLNQDKQVFERNKQLYNEKVISKAELEQYETQFKASQAQYNAALQNIKSLQAGVQSALTGLQMANKNFGRTTITSPMDGVISMLNIKKGERVVGTAQMAGTEMMRVADMSGLEVRVDVGENDIVKVSIGDSADVEVDAYNNRKFKGVVTQIASSTNRSSGTASANEVTNYEVHIRLNPASYQDLMEGVKPKKFPFRPGMNANADIKTKIKLGVLAVPITAVAARPVAIDEDTDGISTDGAETAAIAPVDDLEEVVFLVNNDGAVEKKVVTTGIQDINFIEIISGLKEGEQIVSGPYSAVSKTLQPKTKVKVVTKDKLFED